jgi:hypothetical protein
MISHVLFALTYFDDAERERIPVMFWETRWNAVRTTIQTWVKAFVNLHTE